MQGRIHVLQIHKNQIHPFQRAAYPFKFKIAAGFDIQTEAHIIQTGGKILQKLRLRRCFAAGKGNAAAGIAVKKLMLRRFRNDFIRIRRRNKSLSCPLGTSRHTCAAADAFFPFCIQVNADSLGTDRRTRAAADAQPCVKADNRVLPQSLRIRAPFAVQRTACQKNRGTNPIPVIDGKRLHLHQITLHSHSLSFFFINSRRRFASAAIFCLKIPHVHFLP